MRRVVVLLLFFLLDTMAAIPSALAKEERSNQPISGQLAENETTREGKVLTFLDLVGRSLDQSTYDIDIVSNSACDGSAKYIENVVSSRVTTQIYDGVLKGANGALTSGAANSWDQALLLMKVLELCGRETRLATATLSIKEAENLFSSMHLGAKKDAVSDPSLLLQAGEILLELGASPDYVADFVSNFGKLPPRGQAVPEVLDASIDLVEALGSVMPDGQTQTKRAIEHASRYAWVQSRMPGEKEWLDHHTAFEPTETLVPEKVVTNGVPEKAVHRVSISVELIVSDGAGETEAKPLIKETTYDFLNASRFGTTLSILPDTLNQDGVGRISDAESYAVFFSGQENSPIAFSLDGSVFDARAGKVGNAFSGLADGLAGLGSGIGGSALSDEPEKPSAQAVVATIRILPPFEAEPIVSTRDIWTLEQFDSGVTPAGIWTMFFLGGDAAFGELFQSFVDNFRILEDGDIPRPENEFASATMSLAFELGVNSASADDTLLYRNSPLATITGVQFVDPDRMRASYDIVNSGLLGFEKSSGQWRPAPHVALIAGVTETLLETGFRDGAPYKAEWVSPQSAWQSLSKNERFLPIRSKEELSEVDVTKTVKKHIIRKLDEDSLILLALERPTAWWHVNLETGVVTGYDQYGRGGFSEEIFMIDVALSTAWLIKSVQDCEDADEPVCTLKNFGWTLTTIYGGYWLNKGANTVFEKFGWEIAHFVDLSFFGASQGLNASGWNPFD